MANSRSAEKAARVTQRRTAVNRRVISSLRTYVKNARTAIEKNDVDQAQKATRLAIAKLDQAGGRGFIHQNTASRSKARLTRQLNVMVVSAAPKKRAKTTKKRPTKKTSKAK